MEPLSVTASVISVLQLTNKVIQYLSDVKDAPKECQQCVIEASNLLGLLTGLRYCAERAQAGDPWFEQLRNLNAVDGPLDQYQQALKLLQTSVEIGDGVQKIKKQLSWKDNKEIVRGILARIERLKSLVSVALEMDHR
jgi:flavin-dependent dehydrogenase